MAPYYECLWVLFPHMHCLTVEMMKTVQYLRKEVGVRTKKWRGSADKTRKKMRQDVQDDEQPDGWWDDALYVEDSDDSEYLYPGAPAPRGQRGRLPPLPLLYGGARGHRNALYYNTSDIIHQKSKSRGQCEYKPQHVWSSCLRS